MQHAVNWAVFVVKVFSYMYSMAGTKRKIKCNIHANVVQGHLSEKYLVQKFIAQNIFNTQFTVNAYCTLLCV